MQLIVGLFQTVSEYASAVRLEDYPKNEGHVKLSMYKKIKIFRIYYRNISSGLTAGKKLQNTLLNDNMRSIIIN